MAHSSKNTESSNPRKNFKDKMLPTKNMLHKDEDPTVIAKDVAMAIGLLCSVQPEHSFRHSSDTLQRCKVINSYIGKLNDDINILTEMKKTLEFVTNQLEREKPDIINMERISKGALSGSRLSD